MKDLTIIVLGDQCDCKTTVNDSGSFFEPLSSIRRQLDSHNISYTIVEPDLDKIPYRVESSLVMFIDRSFLVKEDYIFNAVTLNNLHRDAGVFFGPVSVHATSRKNIRHISNSYYRYDLNFGGSYTADITSEAHNYGSLYNAVISGSAYNRIGFSACKTPRSFILDNPTFMRELAKTNKVYYSSALDKVKVLSEKDFEHNVVSDYYYSLGYIDGAVNAGLNSSEKIQDLWVRFVEAPEVADCSNPRWLFDELKEETHEYLELLVLLKCKYQIGYFEGMLGKKLI